MKVAAIQMCSSHQLEHNLQQAKYLLEEAAGKGAKLVVLPEMFPMIGLAPNDRVSIAEAFGVGKIQDFLAHQAKALGIWIVGGTIPISADDSTKVRAACIVYDHQGSVVARYDKIHLFDVVISDNESYQESATIEPGDQAMVVNTPVGKLGLAVCYDIRFPNLFTQLFKQGAQLLAIPAAFTVKTGEAHWQLLIRSRAVENFCYVIGAAQGGLHSSGRQTYGHSIIVDPWGSVIAEKLDSHPGVILAEVDLNYLSHIRKNIPVARYR